MGAGGEPLRSLELSSLEKYNGHLHCWKVILFYRTNATDGFVVRVIFHGGPTNSGKTHNALECLKMAQGGECGKEGGGIYCAPLRLLALEIYNRLNQEGVYTDLLTGQERRQVYYNVSPPPYYSQSPACHALHVH